MKKILIILFTICIAVSSITVINAGSETTNTIQDESYYENLFVRTFKDIEPIETGMQPTDATVLPTDPPYSSESTQSIIVESTESTTTKDFKYSFDIVSVYEDQDSDRSWLLVNAQTNRFQKPITHVYGVFGSRVLYTSQANYPFSFCWGVYDIERDEWVDLCDAWDDETRFPKLHEYYENLNTGHLIGDMDDDNSISIRDATKMQQILAKLDSWSDIDDINKNYYPIHGYIAYLSDFNHDNNRNIVDVSSIQFRLAKIS